MTSSRRLTRPQNRKIQALIAGLALVMLALGLSGVRPTVAEWTDSEQARGSFTAATIPAPTLTANCQYKAPLLRKPWVEIYWQLPEGFHLDDVVVEASTSGLGSLLAPLAGFKLEANTISTGNGTYTTEVPTYLLTTLLGGLAELEISFFIEHDSGWRSNPASVASNAGLILGIGANCRNLTA